jgi:hypothetical protein
MIHLAGADIKKKYYKAKDSFIQLMNTDHELLYECKKPHTIEGYFDLNPSQSNKGYYYRPDCVLPTGFDDVHLREYFNAVKKLAIESCRTLSVDIEQDALCTLTWRQYEGVSETGLNEHTDFGWVTIITASSGHGLQIYENGVWNDIYIEEGEMYLLFGDVMDKHTENWIVPLTAQKHRVINKHENRSFLGFFLDPSPSYQVKHKGKRIAFIDYVREKLLMK